MTEKRVKLTGLFTSPSIRIYPPTQHTFSDWTAEDIVNNRRYLLSHPAVIVLLFLAKPMDSDSVGEFLAEKLDLAREITNLLLADLIKKDLILTRPPSRYFKKSIFHAVTTMQAWREFGWGHAVNYHLHCYNYPFLEERPGGFELANQRMPDYSANEPDTQRFKVTESSPLPGRMLPVPDAFLFQEPAQHLFTKPRNSRLKRLSARDITRILAMTIGITDRRTVNWEGEPLLRKTTPSGGSRHPTEAYLYVRSMAEIEPGYYHAQVLPPQLVRLAYQSDTPFESIFPRMVSDCPFKVRAVIVFTTLFERNMYRYREPRTFRSVHMDVGHLIGTVTALATLAGIRTFVQYGTADQEVELALALNGLTEGVQACVGLG
ncbi:SagB/ThcOx family dehydrogenase [Aeromonas encheleia]|uniref:SagB/ThcOx family dehydrogenase n=1 Tax=Aeromonas encheleia TaxID=73010 RepID=UPI001F55C2EA|nr:SagB/ThcOx family dehydrogenase [Aeromonas encheleia]UNP89048.1 SagB/ThcOx family dehydrogenase [Aeromonas encheleia]